MSYSGAKHFSGGYSMPKPLKRFLPVRGSHAGSSASARKGSFDGAMEWIVEMDDRYGRIAGIVLSIAAVAAAGVIAWQNTAEKTESVPVAPATVISEAVQLDTEAEPWSDTAPVMPETAISPLPDLNAKAVFIDGKIAGRGYVKEGETYISIEPFLASLGISAGREETEDTITLTGQNFELVAYKGQSYIRTNGRYQYVPNGVLMVGAGGADASTDIGADGTSSGTGSGGNMYLPADAVKRIFNVEEDETDETVNISTENMKLIEGGDHYYDITLDANIFYWLPHIVFSEAHDETLQSKLAVANVVLNRVKFDLFPDTIYGVIYDTKYAVQFSPVAIGGIKGTPDELSYVAAFLAVEGYNNVDDCMYYVNPNLPGASDEWFKDSLAYYGTIGSHDYYYKPGQNVPDGTVSPAVEE